MKRGVIVLLVLIVLPVISADIAIPGTKNVEINNYITNINDFPDYVFFSSGNLGPGMCPIMVVGSDGRISDYYKFCDVSVYAVLKNNFNEEKINEINSDESYNQENISQYFDSINAKEVISDLEVYKTTSIISAETSKNNYYSIELEKVKTLPNSISKEGDYRIYVYLAIALIALTIITLLVVKGFKKKK
jgi:hypothetical protein